MMNATMLLILILMVVTLAVSPLVAQHVIHLNQPVVLLSLVGRISNVLGIQMVAIVKNREETSIEKY
jgi:Co/Zn/Cd efflux system component